ncbi:MAG: hypothetical protein OEV42_13565 [Deltaproteobacteria bacterium]|nr:hypothetical protein [Deltaproteobacteria bacterium]
MRKNLFSQILFIPFLVLSIILSSLNLSPAAQNNSPCYEKKGMKRTRYMKSYITAFKNNKTTLGLSREQVDKLNEILKTCARTCLQLSSEIETAEKALEAVLTNIDDMTDKKNIIKKVKEVYSLKAKLELAHFQLLGKADDLLSDEQKAKFRKIPRPAFP